MDRESGNLCHLANRRMEPWPLTAQNAESRVQEMFNYKIDFAGDSNTAILIAPNGYGKTAFLTVLNSCLQFRLLDAADYRFDELNVVFDDKTRWMFKKTPYADQDLDVEAHERRRGMHRRRRGRNYVKFTFFDEKGKVNKEKSFGGIESIPHEILVRAVDRNLPVSRVSYDMFRDLRMSETLTTSEVLERYRAALLADPDFREQLGDYAPAFLLPRCSGWVETSAPCLAKPRHPANPVSLFG